MPALKPMVSAKLPVGTIEQSDLVTCRTFPWHLRHGERTERSAFSLPEPDFFASSWASLGDKRPCPCQVLPKKLPDRVCCCKESTLRLNWRISFSSGPS